MKLNKIYFSAAGTTKKIVEAIAEGVASVVKDMQTVDYPLIKMNSVDTAICLEDLTIFAIPVYAGRVPIVAVEQIRKFKGDKTRAIIVAVYGNREYDDALIELNDIVCENGFMPIAAGAFVAEHSIFPKVAAHRPDENDIEKAMDCDVVFTCLPHGLSADFGGKLIDKGVRVIDLSADFRYDSIDLFEKTYGITHPRPDLNPSVTYGLCELFRDKIKKSKYIANPGCYTTTAILPLYPLLSSGVISAQNIIINASSGATGAGRKADELFSLCESASNYKAYSVVGHRHTSEIEEKLSIATGSDITLNFTPHLLPIKRGILETIYTDLLVSDASIINKIYEDFYKNEPFVSVLTDRLPEIKNVVLSNMCEIGTTIDPRTNKLIIVSAIDNLVKGASGQAIQNMNIMFGFDETTALSRCGNQL